MVLALWAGVFAVALYVLIKGADVFLRNAERMGVFYGLSPFVIGVLIVGVGTSLPELTSAIVAVLNNVSEIVTANAVGSNITNILLVGGMMAVIGGRLSITKDLLDAELPFFVISTALFLGVVYDAQVSFIEALLLFATFCVYLYYLFSEKGGNETVVEAVEEQVKKKKRMAKFLPEGTILLGMLIGLVGLVFGAKLLIDAVIQLAGILNISTGLITLTAVALGTSLPELSVSLRALQQDKVTLAIGNIFGSNAFNILFAVGVPGLFGMLTLDSQTYSIGLPLLAVTSFIFLVIGLARRLYRWEGIMFLIMYVFFVLKLMGL